MTHDELLTRIKEGQWVDRQEMMVRSNALRAVVELHKPWKSYCSYCLNIEGGYMPYPCTEIKAIEKELAL